MFLNQPLIQPWINSQPPKVNVQNQRLLPLNRNH
jgi:hypothetical protein